MHYRIIFCMAYALLISVTCLANNTETIDTLKDTCSVCTVNGQYSKAIDCAEKMLDLTASDTSSFDRLTALAYSGQAFLAVDRYEEAFMCMSSALRLWTGRQNDSLFVKGKDLTPILILYNSLGVYSINYELDYEKAAAHFIKALSIARSTGMDYEYSLISYNLILLLYYRGDSSGLEYAREIYNKGMSESDTRLQCMGAFELAMMYYLKNDYEKAERYILEALNSPVKVDDIWVNNVYATILAATGRSEEARLYYERSLSAINDEPSTVTSFVYLSYGRFLLEQHLYHDAVSILCKGIEVSDDNKNKVFIYQLYESLSLAYYELGEYKKALYCYQKYHNISSNIFNFQKERAINELTIKYKTYLHEYEMQEKDMEIVKKNHALALLIIIIVIVLAVLVVIYVMYRNKNKMYTRIVMQYQDVLRRQQREQIASVDSDKSRKIVAELENLMQKDKIYTDKSLSRDRLVELVGTNRTYLSKVVNDYYGKSVNQLINSYRINHAIELLSVPDSNIPMKAVESESGFSSSSNFFKLFKEYVGMSPAKFREKIIEIANSKDVNLSKEENNNFEAN